MGQQGGDRLDYLTSRMDILDCINRIARGVDRLDRDIFRTGYHADAVLDFGTHIGSPEQHMDFFFALHANMQKAHAHTICNHTCELDGDSAHTETYFLFAARNRDETNWVAGGRYLDRLERRDGAWKIALRTNVIEWSGMLPTMPIPFSEVPDIHANGAPARSKADPSYLRPLVNKRDPQIP